jgi:hypothetical protein
VCECVCTCLLYSPARAPKQDLLLVSTALPFLSLAQEWRLTIMAKPTDERFTLTDEFERPPATSSKLLGQPTHDSSEAEVNQMDTGQDNNADGLGDGMDADGFAGPKIVKPLTPEALAAFRAAQEKAGVIYISRIPPGMQPTKVRHLMSQYGEVGRVYLQKEGMTIFTLDRT